jgi:branched-chain amino acid transport system permease protein
MRATPLAGADRPRDRTDHAQRACSARRALFPADGRPSRIGPAALAAALIIALLAPLAIDSVFQMQVLATSFLGASLAAGLVISMGWAGLLNLSHGTLYGIGAYATASLVTDHGWGFLPALGGAMVIAALGGILLGFATLRVAGDYFALVSLAFTIGVFEIMQNWDAVTHGAEGFLGIPEIKLLGVTLSGFTAGYYTCLVLLIVMVALLALFTTTFAARAMLAVRYDELAAQSMGINVLFTRQLSMALSGALAGLSGAILVATVLLIEPNNFNLTESFNPSLWVIIGGMASVPGAVFAGALITFVTQEFQSIAKYSIGLTGIIVVLSVYFRGGVLSDIVQERLARRRARREVRARA